MKGRAIFLISFITLESFAGGIRTILVDNADMGVIYLKLGQSTILRFSEKPKKVVVGNQNYFSIEFVENDITIQPQGEVSTNLFVYGEYHTYGLLMKFSSDHNYDDLVNVKWKNSQGRYLLNDPTNEVKSKLEKKKGISLSLERVQEDKERKLFIVDVGFKNDWKGQLNTDEIEIELLAKRKKIEFTKVFQEEVLSFNKTGRLRLIFNKTDGSVVLMVKYQNENYHLDLLNGCDGHKNH